MTREEAISEISKIIFELGFEDTPSTDKRVDALNMAIKALEQEPKTGHWIEKDGFDGDVYYDCSECGESWTTIEGTPWDNEWDYCPSCGARMVEPQERSE